MLISIEVVYISPTQQFLKSLEVEEGTTVLEGITSSGILVDCPEIDLAEQKLGIYGHFVKQDDVLKESDRIEIYRPLLIDPKEARRQRAEKGKKKRKA